MLDSAAIGAIIGFLGRAGPEILKAIDRHLDRRHELAMQDKALEFEKLPGRAGKMSEKAMVDAGELQSVFSLIREGYSQQFNTGNPWLNAISVLVRPLTTAALVLLYVGVKVVAVAATYGSPALLTVYGDLDVTLLSGILAFWFSDRNLFKAGR